MGILDSILSGGIGSTLSGIGSLAKDIREIITGEPSPTKKAEIEMKLLELEFASNQAQALINVEEAKHSSIFVAGWRPFIGWVCGIGLFYHYIGYPLMNWIAIMYAPTFRPPILESGDLIALVMGMLGMGGLRTFEKLKGVNRNK